MHRKLADTIAFRMAFKRSGVRLPLAPPSSEIQSGLQSDDDFSSSVSAFDVAEGRSGLVQRVFPVDDRCQLPGFDKVLENDKVPMIRDRKIPAQVLAHER